VAEAAEEAALNALMAADTVEGRDALGELVVVYPTWSVLGTGASIIPAPGFRNRTAILTAGFQTEFHHRRSQDVCRANETERHFRAQLPDLAEWYRAKILQAGLRFLQVLFFVMCSLGDLLE